MSDHDSPAPGQRRWGSKMKSWFTGIDEAADASHSAPQPSESDNDNSLPPSPAVPPQTAPAIADTACTTTEDDSHAVSEPGGDSFLLRMKAGLSRTRDNLASGLATVLIGGKEIDDELMEEMETQLLAADLGADATRSIMDALTAQVARHELTHSQALLKALREQLQRILEPRVVPLRIDPDKSPYVILVVGVNGVGKTTTIGKLAKYLQRQDYSVMLAAGDTFRAAAVEQLTIWGERNQVPVIAQGNGADSASVIFDAIASARAKNIDVVIADTAGRLHNKAHLMEELRKVVRVIKKLDIEAPHEVMLIIDACTGQNAMQQVNDFNNAVPVTGLTVTKLDGTAKGGMLFNLAVRWPIPIRFIGVGERLDDLRPFRPKDFVQAIFRGED